MSLARRLERFSVYAYTKSTFQSSQPQQISFASPMLLRLLLVQGILAGLSWFLPKGIGFLASLIAMLAILSFHHLWLRNERLRDRIVRNIIEKKYVADKMKNLSAPDFGQKDTDFWELHFLLLAREEGVMKTDSDFHRVINRLPDLRNIHRLCLVFIIIQTLLLMRSANEVAAGSMYYTGSQATLKDWFIFLLETGIRSFSDIFEIYGFAGGPIQPESNLGKHLMLLNRLFFDIILLRSLFREILIITRTRVAMKHWKHSEIPVKLVGCRARKSLKKWVGTNGVNAPVESLENAKKHLKFISESIRDEPLEVQ
jgi:hypothetical protein